MCFDEILEQAFSGNLTSTVLKNVTDQSENSADVTHINRHLFATTDMEVSSSSVTTASIPEITPKVIDTWRPKLTSSRKFVVQDDPNTSDFTDHLSGIPKGKASPGKSPLTEWKPDSDYLWEAQGLRALHMGTRKELLLAFPPPALAAATGCPVMHWSAFLKRRERWKAVEERVVKQPLRQSNLLISVWRSWTRYLDIVISRATQPGPRTKLVNCRYPGIRCFAKEPFPVFSVAVVQNAYEKDMWDAELLECHKW